MSSVGCVHTASLLRSTISAQLFLGGLAGYAASDPHRGLIASIDSSPGSQAIARAVTTMCQGLGLDITAEDIERPEQFAIAIPPARPTAR
jgi:hypothetical protein